ncbi:MAG: hypothetical protein Q9221_001159 [Calogaya cf. arnoldii]
MGNTSSQPGPTSSGHHPSPPSSQDDAAASAQLMAESSLAEHTISPNVSDDSMDHSSNPVQPMEKRVGKLKPRLSVLETASDAGIVQAEQSKSPYGCSGFVGAGQDNGSGEDDLRIPRSSYGLDEIDENDERVSSLFQEYESQAALLTFGFDDIPQYNADSPTSFNEVLTGETLVNQQSQSARSEPNGGTKRKRGYGSYLPTSCTDLSQTHDDAQELWNGTGQHAFELDFEAFDEIFANEDTHQANPFSDESGYDIPNGTELSEDMHQTHGDLPPQSDVDVAEVNQPQGKLPRVTYAGHRQKRRRMEGSDSLDSQVPVYVSPYAENEGQQDIVLPGLEDTQARSSPEIPYSQPPGLSHGTSCPSSDAQLTEAPPARLKNPSKSRGNKKQRGGQKGPEYRPPLQELSDKGGMFRDDEIRTLEKFCDRYCEEERIDKQQFNERIHANVRGNNQVKRLYNAIYNEIPYRTRQSIVRFCRRHFHNFAIRGTWTTADDKNLKDAVAQEGTSWKAVGRILDRFPEDCRDRYRNYLINSDKRNTDTWTENEVRNLVKAADDCMRLLRGERARAKEDKYEGREMPESEPESDQEVQNLKLINWQVVSDRMGGTRSRLQCAHKFNNLKTADRDYYMGTIRRLETGNELTSNAKPKRSEPWRLRRSMRKLRNMRTGDKYDFLQLFANCDAASESHIPWNSLGDKAFRKRWKNMDMKAALEMFRKQVPGSERMNYQEVINRVYTKLMAESPSSFDDRWDPKVHGDISEVAKDGRERKNSSDGLPRSEQRQEKSQQRSQRYKKPKSAMLVDSNDDEEDEEEDEVEGPERSKKDNEISVDCDKSDTHPDDSLEEGAHGQMSPEIVESMDEGLGSHRGQSRSASSIHDDDANTILSDVTGTKTSNSRPASNSGLLSDSDTDDSLFNG